MGAILDVVTRLLTEAMAEQPESVEVARAGGFFFKNSATLH